MAASKNTPGNEVYLVQTWHILRKRWKTVLGFAVALVVAVGVASLMMEKKYTAVAVVEISPNAPRAFQAQEVDQMGTNDRWGNALQLYYATQYTIMESRSVMEESVRRLEEEQGFTDMQDEDAPWAVLRGSIEIIPQNQSHLVKVVATWNDPEKAAMLANAVAETYRDSNVTRATEASERALRWLTEQQELYRQRKIDTDAAVHRYRFANDLAGIDGDAHATLRSLHRLESELTEINAEFVAERAHLEQLRSLARSKDQLSIAKYLAATDPVIGSLLQRYQELQLERSELAPRYGERHPEMVRVNSALTSAMEQIRVQVEQSVAAEQARVDVLSARRAGVEAEILRTKSQVEALGDKVIELELLRAEAERNEHFYRHLDTRIAEVGISQFVRDNNIRIVDAAIPKMRATEPRVLLNMVSALFAGLLGGGALSIVLESLDFTLRSREDVETWLRVPLLGTVPRISDMDIKSLSGPLERLVYVESKPKSPVAERFRAIRTSMFFSGGTRRLRRIMVTSAQPREGKSFVTANLAAVLAMNGNRVIVVDADMRRPTAHRLAGVNNDEGLADVLMGRIPVRNVIRPALNANVDIIPAGRANDTVGELVKPEAIEQLCKDLDHYDIIVFDTPPIAAVSDALVLSSVVDGAIFTVEAGRTHRRLAAECVRALVDVTPRMLGVVVNKVSDEHGSGGSYYGYSSNYNRVYGADVDHDADRQTA